jgi:hypothetical protein
VCGHNQDITADTGHLTGRCFQILGLAACDSDVGAGFRKTIRNRLAYASAAAVTIATLPFNEN